MTFGKAVIFFLIFLTCCFMAPGVKSEEPEAGAPEITGISIKEVGSTTEIRIDSNSTLSYTVYKPGDPYNVVVELQDVGLGKFTDKIVVDRAGVMEIIPSKAEAVANVSKLDIILTVPAEIKPVQNEKTLILSFYNPEAEDVVATSEEEPVFPAEEAGEETALEDAETIENIELMRSDDRVDVVISGDGKMYPRVIELEGNKLVVDIPGVTTSVESPGIYEPPVLGIRIGGQPDNTRIVFDLSGPAEYVISEEEKQVILSFGVPEKEIAETVAPPPEEEYIGVTEQRARPRPFASKEYTGEKISLDFQDAELIHIFRLLADVSGYNIVVSPQVKGKFSMKLIDVPWDQALDIILRNYGLSKTVENNIIRIVPTPLLAQEEEAIAKAKEAQEKAGDLVTRIYSINYADVDQIEKAIKGAKILTKRGFVSVDKRTSSLIVKDVEGAHIKHKELIDSLDKPTPQVGIDAKIVEVSKNFTRDLGIQWGVLWRPSPQT